MHPTFQASKPLQNKSELLTSLQLTTITELLYDDVADELSASTPVIDLSLLTSHDPQIHAKAVHQLNKACAEWGSFMLTNHGIPEKLMEELMKKSGEFHDLPMEEKEFSDKGPFTPIRYGTSFYPEAEKVHYWRDYLKVITFPEFNIPHNHQGVAYDYSQKIRGVARMLLEGISESLGLESNSIIESGGFDSGLQLFIANLLCVMGGMRACYTEARAIINNKETRMSLVVANGPALDKEIGPAPELLPLEKEKPLFGRFKYQDYFKIQQRTRFADNGGLDEIRLSAQQEQISIYLFMSGPLKKK